MLKDAKQNYTKEAAQAKLLASEAATFCAHTAIEERSNTHTTNKNLGTF